jgi:hypothetical protein
MRHGKISLDHVSDFFSNDDDELFGCITTCVRRSIPDGTVLRRATNQDLVQTLKRAIEEGGIEALDPGEDTGLDKAYKMGYLHAFFEDPVSCKTIYDFPTILHQG